MKKEYKHTAGHEAVDERKRSSSMKRGEMLYEKAKVYEESRFISEI